MHSERRLLPSFRGLGITINEDALIRVPCPARMDQFSLVRVGRARLQHAINLPIAISAPEKVVEIFLSKDILAAPELEVR